MKYGVFNISYKLSWQHLWYTVILSTKNDQIWFICPLFSFKIAKGKVIVRNQMIYNQIKHILSSPIWGKHSDKTI